VSTIITQNKIRKGDKIKVTYTSSDVEYSRTGVAFHQSSEGDWETTQGIFLTFTSRQNQVIELLERPKTAEEILKERRDALVVKYAGHGGEYAWASELSKQLVDRVIELEDEKEALTK